MKVGPKTRRRRAFTKARIVWWSANLIAVLSAYAFLPAQTFNRLAIPYLLAISVLSPLASDLAALGADSPLDE